MLLSVLDDDGREKTGVLRIKIGPFWQINLWAYKINYIFEQRRAKLLKKNR